MNGAGPAGSIRNWAGSHTYRAARFVEARSVAEVQREVETATKVRVLGTRHSFNDLCDTDGTLLSTTGFPDPVVVDPHARTVTVRGGQRYAVVARAVHEAGLALPNMGSLPHISTAGAVATGTHGSGTANQALGAAVAALVLVGPDGALRTVRRGEPDHPGSVVALGALGVVVEVELDLQERRFRVRLYRDAAPLAVVRRHAQHRARVVCVPRDAVDKVVVEPVVLDERPARGPPGLHNKSLVWHGFYQRPNLGQNVRHVILLKLCAFLIKNRTSLF